MYVAVTTRKLSRVRERVIALVNQTGTMVTGRLLHREGGSIYRKGILWWYILRGVKFLGGGVGRAIPFHHYIQHE